MRTLLAALMLTLAGAAVAEAAFIRFAHPQADDVVQAGDDFEVIAVAIGGAPPRDLVLEYSEDHGATFHRLADQALRGRAIHGHYEPGPTQGSVVLFRTRSTSSGAFNQQIQVFVP